MVHLNIAKDSGLVSAGVINNLAVAVAEAPSPNLEEALRLANVANELLPDHPYLRETRGQIYFKMGNLTKAIPDLEYAVRAPELKKGVYQSLSEIYKSLGQDTLSQEYANLKSKL